MEILKRRPSSLAEFAKISGVGQAKLAKHGDTFLHVVASMANDAQSHLMQMGEEDIAGRSSAAI